MSTSRIMKLDETVVNRIAAGEIIQRPANAIKELLENAVDAGATSIDIIAADGGLKLLQITDNGSGIELDDLSILCERFTTSKLRAFNDLAKISTYGFRGEALASITHIARVTVTTKTKDAICAHKAVYSENVLVPPRPGTSTEPKPTAGNQGTQISVEGMFDNMPARKRAFTKTNEEYSRILDVINKYAIHCSGIAFSCKKAGESMASLSTAMKNTPADNVRLIHGSSVANELLSIEDSENEPMYFFRGLITSANYHVKKFTCITFVNNRLVESSPVRKCVENVYSRILPKGEHPFAYISVQVEPSRLDVNVHPTKREVNLLDEEVILARLSFVINARLANCDHSRSFLTQTIIPAKVYESGRAASNLRKVATMVPKTSPAFVRTDSKQQTLSNMLDQRSKGLQTPDGEDTMTVGSSRKSRTSIQLASVKELRAEIRDDLHEDLTALFSEHVFVGIADLFSRLCVVQHLTKLYLIDYGAVSIELFYQIGLSEFGNFGTIVLRPPLSIRALIKIALEDLQQHAVKTTIDAQVPPFNMEDAYSQLLERRDMLEEYFALKISTSGDLETIPLLLQNYSPSIAKLPMFLLGLLQKVNWEREKLCFRTFLKELAIFYAPESFTSVSANSVRLNLPEDQINALRTRATPTPEETRLRSSIEEVLFPMFKKRLIATNGLNQLKRITQIGELNQLYKVFERC